MEVYLEYLMKIYFKALINSKTYNELQTPLHFASKTGNLQAVKFLLSLFETKQEAKDFQNRTALYLAAEHGIRFT